MSEFAKTCVYCNARIKLSDKQGGKWLPYNIDGSSHDCRTNPPKQEKTAQFTLEAVQRKLESIGIIINVERLMKRAKKLHIAYHVANGLKGSITVHNVEG